MSPTIVFRESDASHYVVSGNGSNAPIVLDARTSSDPDSDELTFAWFVHNSTTAFAVTDLTTQTATVGTHVVDLVVSDGIAEGQTSTTFTVITAADAVAEIGNILEEANLPRGLQRSLRTVLDSALKSLERGNYTKAVEQLQSFEWKAQSQLAPVNAAIAYTVINAAEEIVNALLVANLD